MAGLLVGARPVDLTSADSEESSRLWVLSWLRDPERESDRLIGFRSNTFGGAAARCGDEFGVNLTVLSPPEPSDESMEEEAECFPLGPFEAPGTMLMLEFGATREVCENWTSYAWI